MCRSVKQGMSLVQHAFPPSYPDLVLTQEILPLEMRATSLTCRLALGVVERMSVQVLGSGEAPVAPRKRAAKGPPSCIGVAILAVGARLLHFGRSGGHEVRPDMRRKGFKVRGVTRRWCSVELLRGRVTTFDITISRSLGCVVGLLEMGWSRSKGWRRAGIYFRLPKNEGNLQVLVPLVGLSKLGLPYNKPRVECGANERRGDGAHPLVSVEQRAPGSRATAARPMTFRAGDQR